MYRRRGPTTRLARRGRGGRRRSAAIAGCVIAVIIVLAVYGSGQSERISGCCTSSRPLAVVIFDQPTANAKSVSVSGALGDQLRRAAKEHRRVRLIAIGGDGKVMSSADFDMTPRLADGSVLKVEGRANEVTAENLKKIAQEINRSEAAVPGQSLFLGLLGVQFETGAPIFIVSSLLDTSHPLDFRALGWSVPPERVVADLKRAGELPNLTGAEVTFVVRPVAGEQAQLRQPQVSYREQLWRALAEASGAGKVAFEYVEGTPSTSTAAAPPVEIPSPPKTSILVNPKLGTCEIDTRVWFVPDAASLLDSPGTRAALKECAAQIGAHTSVRVTGHVAGNDADSRFAVELSEGRAQAIADLLQSLGVPPNHIEVVGMGGRAQPYPDPDDPRNRVVVVSIIN